VNTLLLLLPLGVAAGMVQLLGRLF
jgi:hypothetical protein